MNFNELNIIKIDLNVTFSSDESLQCLFFQPHPKLKNKGTAMPYKIDDKQNYSKEIEHLLNLASHTNENGLSKDVKFILMPEYSIHGVEGVKYLLKRLKDSTVQEQILIGGIDGLNRDEFIELLKDSNCKFDEENKKKMISWLESKAPNKWINTMIVIEKFGDDVIYFLQPKLSQSSDGETLANLLEGQWCLFFRTNNEIAINFIVLICSDWMSKRNGSKIINIIGEKLYAGKIICKQGEHMIAFVPQYNGMPNHEKFKDSTNEFLSDSKIWKAIHGTNSMVFMINIAEKEEKYGYSSVIIKDKSSYILNQDNPLNTCSHVKRKTYPAYTDIVFREFRKSIHAIEIAPPFSIDTSVETIRIPFSEGKVHTINGINDDTDIRYPNPVAEVCAYSKVLNDFIDNIKNNNEFSVKLEFSPLDALCKKNAKVNLDKILYDFRKIDSVLSKKIITTFFGNQTKLNCDNWNLELEGKGLNDLISIFSLFKYAEFTLNLPEKLHGSLNLGGRQITFLFRHITLEESKDTYKIQSIIRRLKIDLEEKLFKENGGNERYLVFFDRDIPSRFLNEISNREGQMGSLVNTEPIFIGVPTLLRILENIETVEILKTELGKKLGGRV